MKKVETSDFQDIMKIIVKNVEPDGCRKNFRSEYGYDWMQTKGMCHEHSQDQYEGKVAKPTRTLRFDFS